MSNNIIRDVVTRTKGELYLGVVGAVRSGKSTFIRKFMENKVLPYLNDSETYQKVRDELPQSADGKRVMTVEPKFVPSEHMTLTIDEDVNLSIRLVDCVGYIIPSALGYLNDDGSSRLVKTPWFSEEIPFDEAAKLGTKKVIEAHSHIGIIITSDGSFGDFTREEYASIEKQLVEELKATGKPFVIILNTTKPDSAEAKNLKYQLEEAYNVSVIPLNALELTENDVDDILKEALAEFKISELSLEVPSFIEVLDERQSYKVKFQTAIDNATRNCTRMKDVFAVQRNLLDSGLFEDIIINDFDSGTGDVTMSIQVSDEEYHQILEEIIGTEIPDKTKFIEIIQELMNYKETCQKAGGNLDKLVDNGFGFIIPPTEEMVLQEPELIKQGGRYGIKLKAIAKVMHLTNIEVESSFEPIIGGEMQAKMLLEHMLEEYQQDPKIIWESEFFGRKLADLISDGVKVKIKEVSEGVEKKYQESLTKIVNKGRGGVIAIVL